MSNQLQTVNSELRPEERALLLNDLSQLSPQQRSDLYVKVCQSLGLNPLTQPFQYLELNGKLTFYATRNCTDQLRSLQGVSVTISSREKVDGIYIVTAKATLPNGRSDESIAAVDLMEPEEISKWSNGKKNWVKNPKAGKQIPGDALANAIMKCETKSKRRVTLSICGLSFMDETEVETIKDAKVMPVEIKSPVTHGLTANQVREAAHQGDIDHKDLIDDFNPDSFKAIEGSESDTHLAPNHTPPPVDPTGEQDELDAYLGVDMTDISNKIDVYTIPFGKYSGRGLRDLGLAKCQSYVDWIKSKAKDGGRSEITGTVKDFIDMVDLYAKEFQHEQDTEYWQREGRGTENTHRENSHQ